tara:strand:- start:968 stop:1573 length:606 start_codon:yes stop_codon:yes gene_type:complete
MSKIISPAPKNTRQVILNKSENLFAKQGYRGTTLDHIALAVGIKRPSLIYHFSDKEELYGAMLKQLFSRQEAFFSQRKNSTSSPVQDLNLMLEEWLNYALVEPNYLRIFLQNLATGYQPDAQFWKQARPIVRLWETPLLKGARQGIFKKVDLIHFLSIVGGMTAYYILMQDEENPLDNQSEAWLNFCSHLRHIISSLTLEH